MKKSKMKKSTLDYTLRKEACSWIASEKSGNIVQGRKLVNFILKKYKQAGWTAWEALERLENRQVEKESKILKLTSESNNIEFMVQLGNADFMLEAIDSFLELCEVLHSTRLEGIAKNSGSLYKEIQESDRSFLNNIVCRKLGKFSKLTRSEFLFLYDKYYLNSCEYKKYLVSAKEIKEENNEQ